MVNDLALAFPSPFKVPLKLMSELVADIVAAEALVPAFTTTLLL